MISVEIGVNNDMCGPNDSPCDGPLLPGTSYNVRYNLISGHDEVEFPFYDGAIFSTSKQHFWLS